MEEGVIFRIKVMADPPEIMCSSETDSPLNLLNSVLFHQLLKSVSSDFKDQGDSFDNFYEEVR